uniref:ATP synthase subunit O, mitochondrial-like isoform X1 n=1 Tax=Oncorhynchus gorbuscha TaxID=8017 RepID=UPI001EAEA572|nr:ATP synthase subunit O, mitochondrial-like isoform X1 [Oncorhynchus gorbuscha]
MLLASEYTCFFCDQLSCAEVDLQSEENGSIRTGAAGASIQHVGSPTSFDQAPIDVYGVGGRYATALFSAASKQKKLEQVEKEMRTLSALIKDPKLSSIVMNPHVKRSLKLKFFGDAMTKANLSPITVNLITVLADNGRLTLTADVVGAFAKMMSAHRGEVICTVTTAHPLDEANLAELKVALNGFLAKGETLILETKSDASILGGMIVSIGDKYVDMSTKTKIHKLTKIIRDS